LWDEVPEPRLHQNGAVISGPETLKFAQGGGRKDAQELCSGVYRAKQ